MSTPLHVVREDAVRERVSSLAQAIRDKDVDAVMAHYAPDCVAYDVMPLLFVSRPVELSNVPTPVAGFTE